jgi:hypothetical protein
MDWFVGIAKTYWLSPVGWKLQVCAWSGSLVSRIYESGCSVLLQRGLHRTKRTGFLFRSPLASPRMWDFRGRYKASSPRKSG